MNLSKRPAFPLNLICRQPEHFWRQFCSFCWITAYRLVFTYIEVTDWHIRRYKTKARV